MYPTLKEIKPRRDTAIIKTLVNYGLDLAKIHESGWRFSTICNREKLYKIIHINPPRFEIPPKHLKALKRHNGAFIFYGEGFPNRRYFVQAKDIFSYQNVSWRLMQSIAYRKEKRVKT